MVEQWQALLITAAFSASLVGCSQEEPTAAEADRQISSPTPVAESAERLQAANDRLEWRAGRFEAAIAEEHPELLSAPADRTSYVWIAASAHGELTHTAVDARPAVGAVEQSFLKRFPDLDPDDLGRVGSQQFRAGELTPGPTTVYYLQQRASAKAPPQDEYFFAIPEYVDADEMRTAILEHHPEVLTSGISSKKMLWFLSDGYGNLVGTGSAARLSTDEFRRFLAERYPGTEPFYVRTSVELSSADGRHISVLWAAAEV